jgi:hypothetical protein
MPFSKAKWTAVTGYACAAAGTILFTQLNRIANFRMGHNVLDAAMVGSMSATFGVSRLPLWPLRFGHGDLLPSNRSRSLLTLPLGAYFLPC